jgi:uncharacterized membrane protein
MDIINILHKKKENKQKKIWIMIISIIIILWISLLAMTIIQNNNKTTYDIWDQIYTSWVIMTDDNYPTNTHKIINDNTTLGIKSSSINLNNFNQKNVIINWIINKLDTKYPVIDIKNIKEPKSKLIITDNRYFFTKELISFDFSQDTDITAAKIDNHIQIYYQDKPTIAVETFICNKIIPTQNCKELISTYTNNLNDVFTTYLGYTFYQNKEHSRVTFNNHTLWYIFKTNDDEFLLNISHLINIIDSKFLAENKKDLIKTHCTNDEWLSINNINEINSQIIDNDLTKFNIEWISDSKQKVNCKLTINIRNNREVKNKTINIKKSAY